MYKGEELFNLRSLNLGQSSAKGENVFLGLGRVRRFFMENELDNDLRGVMGLLGGYGVEGKRCLVVGCLEEPMANALGELGGKVTGYDLRAYGCGDIGNGYEQEVCLYEHVVGDAKKMSYENEFDLAVSISVIEHSGLGYYGDEVDDDADVKVCEAVNRALKPGGYFVLTVPVGAFPHRTHHWRRYTLDGAYQRLAKNFEICDQFFFWTGIRARKGLATVSDAHSHSESADLSLLLVLRKPSVDYAEKSNDEDRYKKLDEFLENNKSLQAHPGNFDTCNTKIEENKIDESAIIKKKRGRPKGWRKNPS